MKNEFLKRNICLLVIMALFFFSCSNDDSPSDNSAQGITGTEVKTILEADDAAMSLDGIITDTFMNSTGERKTAKKSSTCYESTFSDKTYSLTFDNCTVDGEIINGTISVVNTSEGDNVSFSATFTAFSAGGIEISGTRNFVFNGNIDGESYSFSATSDLTITLDNSTIVKINGSRTFVFTLGDSLETSTYTINGSWTLQIDGDTYSVVVNNALEGNMSCEYITKGNMTLTKNGLSVDVDYGDGTCDNKATVIYPDETTEEVSLDD